MKFRAQRFGLKDFVERGLWVNMTANGYREDDRRKFVYDVLIGQDVVVTVRVSETLLVCETNKKRTNWNCI